MTKARDLANIAGKTVPNKTAGTDFTNSLLVGHETTGTLSSANYNTGVGSNALNSITSGDKNTVVGDGAGYLITSSGENTGVGRNALRYVATGTGRNTAIGAGALSANDADFVENTALGTNALAAVTGNVNIGIGFGAGDNITSGSGNVMIGEVDADSATGDRQLKIAGHDGSTRTTWLDGDSSGNVTVGGNIQADNIKQEGTNFTDSLIVGHSTTGTLNQAKANTAVGLESLKRITSGDNNTVVGYNAGQSIDSGRHNTGLGRESANGVTSGKYNTCLGYQAGQLISSGDGNVIIGAAVEVPSGTGNRQLVIAGHDDSATTTWITGDSSGNVTVAGTVTANGAVLGAGGGKIGQVLQTVKTDTFSSTTADSFTDITGMTVAITPSATNSKILILGNINSGAGSNAHIRLLRDSTAICVGGASSSRSQVTGSAARNAGSNHSMVNNGISFLDSPSSTSELIYKFQFLLYNSTTFYLNRSYNDEDALYGGRSASTITVMEILA